MGVAEELHHERIDVDDSARLGIDDQDSIPRRLEETAIAQFGMGKVGRDHVSGGCVTGISSR